MGLLDPPGFRRNRHGQFWLHLGAQDRALLGDLLAQLTLMLGPAPDAEPADPLVALVGIDPHATRPEDPALARLFPDAYPDAEDAAEFRRFTQAELRSTKLAHLDLAATSLSRPDPTELSEAEAQAWLGALNDLRLTLAARLEITLDGTDLLADLAEDDPRRGLALVYDWLTYHQDRLVGALTKGLPR
ncbi:MAG: DUF2017 domain-containing protein [Candidatus Nanopelagicales bacterium]